MQRALKSPSNHVPSSRSVSGPFWPSILARFFSTPAPSCSRPVTSLPPTQTHARARRRGAGHVAVRAHEVRKGTGEGRSRWDRAYGRGGRGRGRQDVVLCINKCDMVPAAVAELWAEDLRRRYPLPPPLPIPPPLPPPALTQRRPEPLIRPAPL